MNPVFQKRLNIRLVRKNAGHALSKFVSNEFFVFAMGEPYKFLRSLFITVVGIRIAVIPITDRFGIDQCIVKFFAFICFFLFYTPVR